MNSDKANISKHDADELPAKSADKNRLLMATVLPDLNGSLAVATWLIKEEVMEFTCNDGSGTKQMQISFDQVKKAGLVESCVDAYNRLFVKKVVSGEVEHTLLTKPGINIMRDASSAYQASVIAEQCE